jgi:hypothetical protein
MGAESEAAMSIDDQAIPGHRNYLVYCDESGIDGQRYYGFGSLWMPHERRGDFAALIADLRAKHRHFDEIKWTNVTRRSEAFCLDLIDAFFRAKWLMFHSLIVRRGYSKRDAHKSFDEEKRKRFAMLVTTKIKFFCAGDANKAYHVRVDPLPSRYKKADEAAFKIAAATLKKELGIAPLKTLITRDSKETPGIQLADLLLGATLADWQQVATAPHKLRVRRAVAEHVGWPDLRADTHVHEWKFNIWNFHDPTAGHEREVQSRRVELRHSMPPFRRGAAGRR